jgi:hypothetical protein
MVLDEEVVLGTEAVDMEEAGMDSTSDASSLVMDSLVMDI